MWIKIFKNGIFVLPLPEYVWFGGAMLILNSTITFVGGALSKRDGKHYISISSPLNHLLKKGHFKN